MISDGSITIVVMHDNVMCPMIRSIFPLHTVICPQGRVPLQIFERRYLTMVSQVLRSGEGFVIVLLKEGNEVGGTCRFYDIGVLVNVVDFQGLPSGFLGITVEAAEKVTISEPRQRPDGLYEGNIALLPEEPFCPTEYEDADLSDLLCELLRHPVVKSLNMSIDHGDARSLGWRLVDLLPFSLPDKQFLLALNDPRYRLEQIRYLLHAFE
jgi:Lon protease-like protein